MIIVMFALVGIFLLGVIACIVWLWKQTANKRKRK